MSAYDADRLWVFALSAVLAAVLIAVAFLLLDRRDLGAGLLVARPGPPRADRLLSSPEGLVWRLDRATVLGWAICGIVLGLVVGGLTSSVQDMLSDPSVADMLRRLGGERGPSSKSMSRPNCASLQLASPRAGSRSRCTCPLRSTRVALR